MILSSHASLSLSCFCRYLSFTLNSTMIRKQDATSVITSVASNREGQDLAWSFVQEHWDYMFTQWVLHTISNMYCIPSVCIPKKSNWQILSSPFIVQEFSHFRTEMKRDTAQSRHVQQNLTPNNGRKISGHPSPFLTKTCCQTPVCAYFLLALDSNMSTSQEKMVLACQLSVCD